MEVAVVIPCYQPSEVLVELVRSLVESAIERIVVIDDGSGPSYQNLFERAGSLSQVVVLRHEQNRGKGAALKTGIHHVVRNFPQCTGVVTADADGQHEPADIVAVVEAFATHPDSMILGSREFRWDVPWASFMGNRIIRRLIRLLVGPSLSDTQTGLRAIPAALFPVLLKIQSTGYEFELEMLIAAWHRKTPIIERGIETIYSPGNSTSHFDPLMDSLKITVVLFRFITVSFVTAVLDCTVFILAFNFTGQVLISQVTARAAAACFNYPAGRRAVFLSDGRHRVLLPRYLGLVAMMGAISYWLMDMVLNPSIQSIFVSKVVAEGALFALGFFIQRDFVFRSARV